MARIKSKDTQPELRVRRLAHALGYRYRVHRRDLPGCPDLVFPSRRKVIFVHGCFWHGHKGCKVANKPKSRTDFWLAKFDRNRTRDAKNLKALSSSGWRVFTVWECETKNTELLASRLVRFLGQAKRTEAVRKAANG
jgi:DNA mismatch endonuclease (patch repair protein)